MVGMQSCMTPAREGLLDRTQNLVVSMVVGWGQGNYNPHSNNCTGFKLRFRQTTAHPSNQGVFKVNTQESAWVGSKQDTPLGVQNHRPQNRTDVRFIEGKFQTDPRWTGGGDRFDGDV